MLKQFNSNELNLIFGVSRVTFAPASNKFEHVAVDVKHHEGQKCERCWQFFDKLEVVEDSCVCPRCKKGLHLHE